MPPKCQPFVLKKRASYSNDTPIALAREGPWGSQDSMVRMRTLRVFLSAHVVFGTGGDQHKKSYEHLLLAILGVFLMICLFCKTIQVFWDCKSIMSWNTALKFAGDTSSILKKLYSEFQPKKLTWHMYYELKTTEKTAVFRDFDNCRRSMLGFLGENLEVASQIQKWT